MFVARENEIKKLDSLLQADKSSLCVVYGRRRIGKTETIRYFIKSNELQALEITGVYKEARKNQIKSFLRAVDKFSSTTQRTTIFASIDWSDAFFMLEDVIEKHNVQSKKVIFLDEFPWLDSPKSGFFEAFSHFWNNFCSKRDDIIVIVCGSAASYMMNKIIKNKKTLHNRVTQKISIDPFDLKDTKKLIDSKGCHYSDKSIIDLYMVFGGVAKYIDDVDCTKTPHENIQNMCFSKDGILMDEYEDLYESLFERATVHRKVMNLLSSKWSGYTQKQIALLLKTSASSVTIPLKELELSGFISSTPKFGQKVRDKIFRATDSFSYFHNKWMKGSTKSFNDIFKTQSYKSWAGFAFENICHIHKDKIKSILGISGVATQTHYWNYENEDQSQNGAQIDMLLEYVDGSKNIDIVECKYYSSQYTIDKEYKNKLLNKIDSFNKATNYKYNIRLIFITSNGVVKNQYYNEIINKDITIDELFDTK
ncbi:MAG: ATP-binding protein [Campylobacterota bacterium]|nr:ATP-binding protein [Campylobacterota bacterium]